AELRVSRRPVPLRTVWNGVDFAALARTPSIETLGRAWRERLGFAPDDLVLVAVANPRPQKRLPLLPDVLAATRRALEGRGSRRQARLVLAGGGHRTSNRAVLDQVRTAAARPGMDHPPR